MWTVERLNKGCTSKDLMDFMQLKTGDVIGSGRVRFVVRDVKGGPGKSGFGIVYLLYCDAWKQMVAVKTLQDRHFCKRDAEADKVVEDFYHEAETWMKLGRNPRIVEAITVSVFDWGQPYIVLEYVDGGNLSDQLLSGRISVRQALKFGIEFCHGMMYANNKDLGEGRRGIVHRDIKPANLMLTREGLLKITDFGLVKALGVPSAEKPTGTPEYMSPEQFVTMDVDTRSDIYSFGVVMYEMLTGRLPFYTEVEDERWDFCMHHHQEAIPVPPSRIDPSIPSELEQVILKCLEKRPEDRYERFEALKEELFGIYQAFYGGVPELKEEVRAITAETWSYRGIAFLNLGKCDDAINCNTNAITIDPSCADAWLCSGMAYYGLGKMADTIRCLEKVLEINPKNEDAWANLGVALKALGKFFEAKGCLSKALEINPRNWHAWEMMGMTLYDSTADMTEDSAVELLEEAVRCFDRALEINPVNPTAWNNRGAALNRLGVRKRSLFRRENERFNEAIKCFDKAIEISPRYSDAWVSKAAALSNLGKFEDALRCLDRALEIKPEHRMAWSHKVSILEKLNRREEARRCAAEACFWEGVAWARKGEFWEAIKFYDQALKLNPNHVKAWNNKGTSLSLLGMRKEAIECYDRALEIDSTDISVWKNKATILRTLGRKDEAERCEKMAIELERQSKRERKAY